jgi:GNAT superfamily N-acetyltransferase
MTGAFTIREASAAGVPAPAQLHVVTFIETRSGRGPSFETREWQWREAFARPDPNWFCYVICRQDGGLIGFAKGVPHAGGVPGFAGALNKSKPNKIYLLREHHRRGLGSRLLGHVSRRFLARASIPCCCSAMQIIRPRDSMRPCAERLYAAGGEFHGGYGWRDLHALATRCPAERVFHDQTE